MIGGYCATEVEVVTGVWVTVAPELVVAADVEGDSDEVEDGKAIVELALDEEVTLEELELGTLDTDDELCPEVVVVVVVISVVVGVDVVVVAEVIKGLEPTGDEDPGLGWELLGRSLNKFHGRCC